MKSAELQTIDFEPILIGCYDELKPRLMDLLERLRGDLAALPSSVSQDEMRALFKDCIIALNNLEYDTQLTTQIETEERQCLCNALCKLGMAVEFRDISSLIEKWRDW